MAYELRDGGGTMFRNKFKKEGDMSPDYRGEAMWRGEKVEVAGWVKEGKSGKFLSLKFQEPRDKITSGPQKRDEGLDDTIPF